MTPSASDTVFKLVSSDHTVTKSVSESPGEEVAKVARLFSRKSPTHGRSVKREKADSEYTREDLDRAEGCGKFPCKPSDLFLKMYSDILDTLERHPLINLVSPPLMGASGVILLSIVSAIPDIMRHYRYLISNAEIEVVIATNYLQKSYASSLVCDALIQLSGRHQGKPTKPVVKLICDRGDPKQFIRNRIRVPPEEWETFGMPKFEDIPNIDFEMINYHRPLMGTFHSKYLIVDRKIVCLNSNNIQDRANIEMMTHIEGPIVDAFYDMNLLSWSESLHPPLPLLKRELTSNKDDTEHKFSWENRYLKGIELMRAARSDRLLLHPEVTGEFDVSWDFAHKLTTGTDPKELPGGSYPDMVAKQHCAPQALTDVRIQHPKAGPEVAEGFRSHILHKQHGPFPIAMANRAPRGMPGHGDLDVPQNVAWLAGFRLAKKNIFIQSPTFNAAPAVKAILDACRRGVECTLYLDLGFNDGGEQLPLQGGTNSKVVSDMYQTLTAENRQQHLRVYWYVAKDQERPIDAAERKRNCHIKFCSIDDQVSILGNGNQDTQSWFHSQESNIMVDSHQICAEWQAGLENNQNTAAFGRVDERDGMWRDKDGNVVDSSLGKGSVTALLKGAFGVVARVSGLGGF